MTANYDVDPPKPRRPKVNGGHRLKASSGKLRLLSVEALDGRTHASRRYRDLVAALVADQGETAIGEARTQLIRRFATTVVLAEDMEARLVQGTTIDIADYSQLTSTMVRLASRIGLDRVPRDVTPATLQDYIAKRQAEVEAADLEEADG